MTDLRTAPPCPRPPTPGAPRIPLALLAAILAACASNQQAPREREPPIKLAAQPPPKAQPKRSEEDVAKSLLGVAEAAWEKRATRAQLEAAIDAWERYLGIHPADAQALTRLSRAYYHYADAFLRPEGEKQSLVATHEKGVQAGERAMMGHSEEFAEAVRRGEKVESAVASIPAAGQAAIYWYASNLREYAISNGFTATLFYKERIVAVMERVLEIDETFLYGAPHRYLGEFYASAPAIAGGDIEKSKEHFERALAVGPDCFGTKVVFAKFYATKTGDRELFMKLLLEVTEADPKSLPAFYPEQRLQQKKAALLLQQVDDLF